MTAILYLIQRHTAEKNLKGCAIALGSSVPLKLVAGRGHRGVSSNRPALFTRKPYGSPKLLYDSGQTTRFDFMGIDFYQSLRI